MINIAEKLKSAPTGTKLYSPIFGACELTGIDDRLYPVSVKSVKEGKTYYFDKFGFINTSGECLLFPSKENRDWENWRHCEFEKGETVLVRNGNECRWVVAKFVEKVVDLFNVNFNDTDTNYPYRQCIKFQDPYKV